ncbi:MAG: secondary thiamine-phosphate synthase enzyme YjbQ [Opitutales bacterium]
MAVHIEHLQLRTQGKGTYEFTAQVERALRSLDLEKGTVTLFCQHTSASLVLMENADPTARSDLERFLDHLVPEVGAIDYAHTQEGPDDMTSHIKMALMRTSEVIPFERSRLLLGTWQGIFLWEHRVAPRTRTVVLTFQGD